MLSGENAVLRGELAALREALPTDAASRAEETVKRAAARAAAHDTATDASTPRSEESSLVSERRDAGARVGAVGAAPRERSALQRIAELQRVGERLSPEGRRTGPTVTQIAAETKEEARGPFRSDR